MKFLQTTVLKPVLCLSWLLLGAFGLQANTYAETTAQKSYNETFDETGAPREEYKRFQEFTSLDPLNPEPRAAEALLNRPLEDKIQIFPIPLILSSSEVALIKEASFQRVMALQLFFEDIVLRHGRVFAHGIVPRALMDQIAAEEGYKSLRNLRGIWAGKHSKYINFIYGPDIVRGPDGTWRVLEDNIGPVGGQGDLTYIHSKFLEVFLEIFEANPKPADSSAPGIGGLNKMHLNEANAALKSKSKRVPLKYYHALEAGDVLPSAIEWFRIVHGVTLGQLIALHPSPEYTTDRLKEQMQNIDLEADREGYLLEDAGITEEHRMHILFASKKEKWETKDGKAIDPALIVKWNRESSRRLKRDIRAIINVTSPRSDIDAAVLVNLFKKYGIAMLNAPGTTILSHKALLPYVDQLIEFYGLGKPLIRTQPSQVFEATNTEAWKWRQLLLKSNSLVLKRANANHGSGVYILPKLSFEERTLLLKQITEENDRARAENRPLPLFIIQKYVEPSTLVDHYIDVRPIQYVVDVQYAVGTPVPWGRAAPKDSKEHGKTNVSLGAKELVVLYCNELLTEPKVTERK